MRLGRLAYHEGVEPLPARGGGVQHGRGDRVGAHGEPADRVEVQVGREVEEDLPDERRGLAVQRDPAQVHVIVGLKTRGEGHLAVHHGQLADEGQQQLAVGHGPTVGVLALDTRPGLAWRLRRPKTSGR